MNYQKRVLFLQCTNAGLYPPIIHAAQIFAEKGWLVDILSSPDAPTSSLLVPPVPSLTHHMTKTRGQNAVRPSEYFEFFRKGAGLSRALRPDVIYASDQLGSGPGVVAALVAGATLIYHEHDSPAHRTPPSLLVRFRKVAARRADLIILPNAERGRLLCEQTGVQSSKLRIVWNMPRTSEMPRPAAHESDRLTIYFHGSITPDRLPMTVVHAALRFHGRVRILIAGYEVPGAPGYTAQLVAIGNSDHGSVVEYLGQIPHRDDLLRSASNADVGLAFMPMQSDDVNMRHMVGASNKPFDYMAAGLALLVSDLPDWVTTYCAQGFARCCNPASVDSVTAALGWFLEHPTERRSMGARGRETVRSNWNYDIAFAPIVDELSALIDQRLRGN